MTAPPPAPAPPPASAGRMIGAARSPLGVKIPPMPIAAADLEPVIAASRRGVAAMAQANGHALARLARVNGEMLGFVTWRFEEDRAALREIADCHCASEAMTLCSAFFESAVRQYSDHMNLMSAISAEQIAERMNDAEHEIDAAASMPSLA